MKIRKRISFIYRRLLSAIKLLVDAQHWKCAVCGYSGPFIPWVGNEILLNEICPICGSHSRHRLYALFLDEHPKINLGVVLHFAPENRLKNIFSNFSDEYVTADLLNSADYVVDIQNMDFRDCKFDSIILNHVLEHVEDDRAALSECRRVLKRDGRLFITVPMRTGRKETFQDDAGVYDKAAREKYYGQADHVRYYGRDLLELIKWSGFQVDVYQPGYIESVSNKINLDEFIMVCSKI